MIKSFKCKHTEELFYRQKTPAIDPSIHRVAFRKLRMIHKAKTEIDLRSPPGNHFEKLKGNREGQHSIKINDKYRICFIWEDGDAFDVEITDYHG